MIAMNYRKFADALIAQLELDLSGVQDAATRSAWWEWLMEAGKPQAVQRPEVPGWWRAVKAAGAALARLVRTAIADMFEGE